MTNHKIQFVGSPCGQHGNYTFYKALKYSLHGQLKILALGEFFFIKIWEDEDIISIGEAQLLWEDKTSGQILASLRIYFLPENTPEGRCEEHGQHEVISLSEKVVLRAEDVISIMRSASGVKWDAGLMGVFEPQPDERVISQDTAHYTSPLSQSLDIKEVLKEKVVIGDVVDPNTLHVIVLSYDSYCRMRGLLKRLEGTEEETMKSRTVKALGGFVVPSRKTKLLFCRDVFDYPELEGHDLLCNHLAPKLQGRPRKKKRRPDSESESSETSEDQKPRLKGKPGLLVKSNSLIRGMSKSNSIILSGKLNHGSSSLPHQIKNEFSTPALDRLIEVDFMSKLYKFMKDRNTAITRIPFVGFKQLNVFDLFTRVQQLGGYEVVIQKKLWKYLYEDLVGKHTPLDQSQSLQNNVNTLKKHYERLLLPYETYLLQEQQRILGIDLKKPINRSRNLLPKHQRLGGRNYSSQGRVPSSQYNQSYDNNSTEETGEPSVSILQPEQPIGASFQVADGGSTTITLVPPNEAQDAPTNLVTEGAMSPPLTPGADKMVPKVKNEILESDLSKRPEITITPIPRSISGPPGLSSLQLADLMTLNVNLNSSLGVSALQDLAKIAERYEKAGLEPPSPKRLKAEDGGCGRMNGSCKDKTVPDLVSADHLLRHMNDSKLLLPAHQSTKTINALAALLPQTSIFPAPAPAAHQHTKVSSKHQGLERPEPVFQSLSVYSQSKNIYGKPTITKDDRSPEIEILDLRMPNETKSDRLELELLDLSTRRDITVSAVSKPGTSKNHAVRIPPPQVSIKSTDKTAHWHHNLPSRPKSPDGPTASMAALASAFASQGLPPASLSGIGSPLFNYLMTSSMKQNAQQQAPMFPEAAMLSHYYNMMPHGIMSPNAPGSSAAGNAAAAAAVQQAAAAAQIAQLNSLGLAGLQNMSAEAMASLGIYKNYLPQGNLPPPHFLSGLMSPQNPSTSK